MAQRKKCLYHRHDGSQNQVRTETHVKPQSPGLRTSEPSYLRTRLLFRLWEHTPGTEGVTHSAGKKFAISLTKGIMGKKTRGWRESRNGVSGPEKAPTTSERNGTGRVTP